MFPRQVFFPLAGEKDGWGRLAKDLKAEIAAQGYDLSLNRYREVEHEEVEHRDPQLILAELMDLEREIQDATAALAKSLAAGVQ